MLARQKIKKVAVLGAGVMGAQIAAHFINAGFETVLFDLASEGTNKSKTSINGIKHLAKLKPAPLATNDLANYLQSANYDDDLDKLTSCDLIIEAIAERIDFKKSLYEKILPHLGENTIVATNTSGLSIDELAESFPEQVQQRFLGIHFFNPPRYMHLTEIIPCAATQADVISQVEAFLVSDLGKGVVHAKDTPNFIANRIGVFSILSIIHHAKRLNIDFEIVDQLTGPLIGRPKSATFRTMDVVGLDTMAHVVNTMTEQLKDDPWHSFYQTPDWLQQLIEQGALGQKTRCGIYKKEKKDILVLDIATRKYRPASGKVSESVLQILKMKSPAEKFLALYESEEPQAQFLWSCFCDLWHYCASHLIDIAHSVRDIDLAIRWGFGWQQGPFEMWQLAGWQTMAKLVASDIETNKTMVSNPLPSWVTQVDAVYSEKGAYSPGEKDYLPRSPLPIYQRQITTDTMLGEKPPTGDTIYENDGVRLWHTGDEIAILSFKSKANTIGLEVITGMLEAINIAERDFKALVLWQNDLNNFSFGADLKQFATLFQTGDKAKIDDALHQFQKSVMALKYSSIPTIAAVRGKALGGGCEVLLHCDHVVASLESYVGLVEVGVGLLPAGGGLKEFAQRGAVNFPDNILNSIQKSFKMIAMAEVATSGLEAKAKGFFKSSATVIMNPHEVLFVAKEQAKAMAQSVYQAPIKGLFPVAGTTGIATLQMLLVNFREGGFISQHDYFIASKVAQVICGGNVEPGAMVDENWILKLERDAFVELAITEKSQARIQQILETGKPLRN